MTWIILGTLIVGVLTGGLLPDFVVPVLDNITTIALCLLIFGVGVGLGRDRQILACLRAKGLSVVIIPLLIAAGSLAGTAIYALLARVAVGEAVAVGAGLGWYSLVGPLLSELHSARLGAVAFLANSLREFISFLIIPIVAKRFGAWSAIAPSAAAAMDVTLPLIARETDPETAVMAFVSGTVLSLLVPLILPLIVSLI